MPLLELKEQRKETRPPWTYYNTSIYNRESYIYKIKKYRS